LYDAPAIRRRWISHQAQDRKESAVKMQTLVVALLIAIGAPSTFSRNHQQEKLVTLYPPYNEATGTYDEGRACFSFKYGARKDAARGLWDLGYGFAAINGEDWFILWGSNETRTVIKDLSAASPSPLSKIPALEPLPRLAKGESRHVVVDASADTGEKWAKTTTIMARVILGHMYLVRVKDEETDMYVLFRVEDFAQGDHCTISWRVIPSPEG
jgi:hypothetical protein